MKKLLRTAERFWRSGELFCRKFLWNVSRHILFIWNIFARMVYWTQQSALLLGVRERDESTYGIDTETYDVIKGWRANASYFYIAKEFVRDNIDVDILEELLSLGGLGIQYCIKTERAYAGLHELKDELETVEYTEFNDRYNARDIMARKKMRDLVNSDANTVTNVFSTLLER